MDKIPPARVEEQTISDSDRPYKQKSLSRRSMLGWLGKATMLSLTGDWLIACAEKRSIVNSIPPDTILGSFEFPFAPSSDEDPIYEQWPVNTVDLQEIEKLLDSWELTINGLVEEPRTLSFSDLLTLSRQDQITDFHCVQGWSVLDVPWNGVHMGSLIDLVRPTSEATHITLHCFRGIYSESIPLSVAIEPRTLLAYGIGGATLPLDHGFPLRLIVPRMYGYKSAKWLSGIEFSNNSEEGYWEKYNYPSDAEVPSSRLREGKY